MSSAVEWIAAESERGHAEENAGNKRQHASEGTATKQIWEDLPAHNFPASAEESALDRNPEIWLYRGRTAAMLRRYMKFALDVGRVPSLLGRDFFRSRVTSYSVTTFEDRVIFVHDVERSLERLDEGSRQVLARVVLQEYGWDDAARLLHCGRSTMHRKLVDALDALSEILLEMGLLQAVPRCTKNSCQEGENDDLFASDCNEDK